MIDMSLFLAAGPYTIAMNRIAYIESREGGSLLVHLVNNEVLAIMPEESDRMVLMTCDRLLMRDPIEVDGRGAEAAPAGGRGVESLQPPETRPPPQSFFSAGNPSEL